MASPNGSTNAQEISAITEVAVVTPLLATIVAIEDMMVEEPPVFTRRNSLNKSYMTVRE